MKLMSRIFLLLSITALLAGCKLAVIVVEGGSVQSTGSGTCVAGTICIVDVTDPNFYEHFEAVSDEGWYFHKWNSGDRFLCGGSINAACTLSFQGYQESKAVKDMVVSSETFYLMPIFRDYPRAVEVGGKAWLQPKDFVNYSYNEVSAVCPGGVCSGNLPGSSFDLTGYTWASSDDVNMLFSAYQTEGRLVLEDFAYTTTDLAVQSLNAMVSDPPYEDPEFDQIYIATAFNVPPDILPYSISAYPIGVSQPESRYGAWFWR